MFANWLGEQIARRKPDLTALARSSGISRAYLYHLRIGTRQRPSRLIVERLATALESPSDVALRAAGIEALPTDTRNQKWSWTTTLFGALLHADFEFHRNHAVARLSAKSALSTPCRVLWRINGTEKDILLLGQSDVTVTMLPGNHEFNWTIADAVVALTVPIGTDGSTVQTRNSSPIRSPQKESGIFQESLFTTDTINGHSSGRWVVVAAKARMEKQLAMRLRDKEVAFYLPLVEKRWRSGNRTRRQMLPIFENYLFAYLDGNDTSDVYSTKKVGQIINVPSVAQVELFQDLKSVYRLIMTGVPVERESHLEPGQRVRVKSGALEGLEGVVLNRRGETRLLVAVHFLFQGASIQIKRELLEPI